MNSPRSNFWKWSICGLLLLATMLNYMDRQTLAQTITDIQRELGLNDAQYGRLETGFGLAFAAGGLFFGFVADKVNVYFLYPIVLIGWSLAGFGTAYAYDLGGWLNADSTSQRAYLGFLVCRVMLGFFEAGQWPCALVTTSRLLSRDERSLGNSILQSGAALGAIFTPLVVQLIDIQQPGSWRLPFQMIGLVGMLWVVPWFVLMRPRDLGTMPEPSMNAPDDRGSGLSAGAFWRRFITCAVIVIAINLTWQFFRAWLPKFLREYHEYDRTTVNFFTSGYYIATDLGCIAVGAAVRILASKGWDVHLSRVVTFTLCALLTGLSVPIAFLPAGPLLLGLLLVVGAASLGLFPNYYAFTQDLSSRHLGKLTGILSAITWVVSAGMQWTVGEHINATQSYQAAIIFAGLVPLAGVLALFILWRPSTMRSPRL